MQWTSCNNAHEKECSLIYSFASTLCIIMWRIILAALQRKSFLRHNFLIMQVDAHWVRNPNLIMWDYKQYVVLDPRMHYQFVCIIIDPPFVTSKVGANYAKGNPTLAKIWRNNYIKHNPRKLDYVTRNVESGGSSISTLHPTLSFLKNYASIKFSSHNPKILMLSQAWCIPCVETHILQNLRTSIAFLWHNHD